MEKKLYNQDSWNLMYKTDEQNNNKKDYFEGRHISFPTNIRFGWK